MRLKIDKSTKEVCSLKCHLCGEFIQYKKSSFRSFGMVALDHLRVAHGIDVFKIDVAQLNDLKSFFQLSKDYKFEDLTK
jgi:hypothetical protein